MANEVKFNIKLLVDGKEKIVEATTDVRKFAQEFEDARTSSTRLRDELLKLNQVGESFDRLIGGLQQLTGMMQQFTQANTAQAEAEAKLANNMRNTMAAREADIESIKALCSAQQELGVIGDEVQLAGAQELATYLEKKSSLEALIPVMNDMLAQQYGLNASSEAAAQIASMLGKVMDGQVGALSRYGYKFDEAQEQVLKFGTEEERAAVLAEVVESAVGGMNQSLAQTDAGRAKQLANAFGDMQERVGALIAPYESLILQVGQLGMAMNAVVTMTTGVAGATQAMLHLGSAVKAAVVSGRALTAVYGTWRQVAVTATAMTRVLGAAMTGASVGAATLKVAIRGLLISTGVGAAIAALGFALEKLFGQEVQAAEGARELTAAQETQQRTYAQTRAAMDEEIAKLKSLIDMKGDTVKAVQELNAKYGESFGQYKTAAEWYDTLVSKSEDYCMQLAYEAEMRVLYEQKAQNRIKQLQNFDERKQLWKDGKAQKAQKFMSGLTVYSDTQELKDARKEGAALIQEGKDINKRLELVMQERDKVKAKLGTPPGRATGAAHQTDGAGKAGIAVGAGTPAKVEKAPAVEGSFDWYEERLQDLRKALRSAGSEAVAAELQQDYEALEREFKDYKIRIGIEKPDEKEVEAVAELLEPEVSLREAKRQTYDDFSSRAQRIQQDYEVGIVGKDKALEELAELNIELEKLGMEPVEVKVMTEDVEKAKAQFEAATDAVGQMGSAFSGLGNALELPELNVAGTIAQAIATMATGYAKATVQAADLGPWGWIAFAATGLAQLAAMISSVKGLTAFADGGIVSGPTMALVGEYAGASNNPEVIAPLDKLRGMLRQPAAGVGGRVRFELEGRKLVGVLANETRISSKSGRRTGIVT